MINNNCERNKYVHTLLNIVFYFSYTMKEQKILIGKLQGRTASDPMWTKKQRSGNSQEQDIALMGMT